MGTIENQTLTAKQARTTLRNTLSNYNVPGINATEQKFGHDGYSAWVIALANSEYNRGRAESGTTKSYIYAFTDISKSEQIGPGIIGEWVDGTVLTLTAPAPLPSWEFANWQSRRNNTTYINGAQYTVNGSDVLEAVWRSSAVTYRSITFIKNPLDGDQINNMPSNGSVTDGGNYQIPNITPTSSKSNVFMGWCQNSTGTGTLYKYGTVNDTIENVRGDITLYAIWSAVVTHTLSFSGNGQFDDTITAIPKNISNIKNGGSVQIPEVVPMSRSGFIFRGWCVNSLGEGKIYEPTETITDIDSNITLYAIWFAVNIKTDSLVIEATTIKGEIEVAPKDIDLSECKIAALDPETGDQLALVVLDPVERAFRMTAEDDGILPNTSYDLQACVADADGNEILSSKRGVKTGQQTTCTVTFDGNRQLGDTVSDVPEPMSDVVKDEEIILPAAPTSTKGFAFLGWCTNTSGAGNIYKPTEHATIEDDTTFYALWLAIALKNDLTTTAYTINGNIQYVANGVQSYTIGINIAENDGPYTLIQLTETGRTGTLPFKLTKGNGIKASTNYKVKAVISVIGDIKSETSEVRISTKAYQAYTPELTINSVSDTTINVTCSVSGGSENISDATYLVDINDGEKILKSEHINDRVLNVNITTGLLPGTNYNLVFSFTNSGEDEVFADTKYTTTKVKVTYKNGGGTGADIVETLAIGQYTLKDANTFSKTDYTLTKWVVQGTSTKFNPGANVILGSDIGAGSNVVLVAEWTEQQQGDTIYYVTCNSFSEISSLNDFNTTNNLTFSLGENELQKALVCIVPSTYDVSQASYLYEFAGTTQEENITFKATTNANVLSMVPDGYKAINYSRKSAESTISTTVTFTAPEPPAPQPSTVYYVTCNSFSEISSLNDFNTTNNLTFSLGENELQKALVCIVPSTYDVSQASYLYEFAGTTQEENITFKATTNANVLSMVPDGYKAINYSRKSAESTISTTVTFIKAN